MSAYEVKNVKLILARVGTGFTGTLTRDGRAVAAVRDRGDGGPTKIRWRDRDEPAVTARLSGQHGPHDGLATPEEAAFHAHLLAAPPYQGRVHTPDTYVEVLVGGALDARRRDRRAGKE